MISNFQAQKMTFEYLDVQNYLLLLIINPVLRKQMECTINSSHNFNAYNFSPFLALGVSFRKNSSLVQIVIQKS
mgnify:CR=1 FL=1